MDCNLPGSSVRGILWARILEWVAISSPGHLPDTGIGSGSPALWVDSLPTEPPGNERNANQNYNEVSPHTDQNGHHSKVDK